MNSTNRGLNRALILACGLLLLLAGAAAAVAALIPAIHDGWERAADRTNAWVSTLLQQTPLGDTGVSWIMPVILAVMIVVVALLVVFIARQGRGRTGIAVTEPAGEQGTTVIDAAVPEQLLHDALDARPEFVASDVSTYQVRRVPVLKVAVSCRRGVSPKGAAAIVESNLRALDELLGRELPALIRISSGFRARVSRTTRLQ